MITSGNTAIGTNGDANVTLLNLPAGGYVEINVINEGAAPGFISMDAALTWSRLPAGPSARTFRAVTIFQPLSVLVRRVAGGTDMAGLWADAR